MIKFMYASRKCDKRLYIYIFSDNITISNLPIPSIHNPETTDKAPEVPKTTCSGKTEFCMVAATNALKPKIDVIVTKLMFESRQKGEMSKAPHNKKRLNYGMKLVAVFKCYFSKTVSLVGGNTDNMWRYNDKRNMPISKWFSVTTKLLKEI